MRVLITRPNEDAALFAERLRRAGHQALAVSLLVVRFRDGAALALEGMQGFLATSANGVRALASRTERRDLPLYAVGPQTAQAARLAGFARVESAGGDAVALAEALPRWARAEDGALFHAAGSDGAGRLAMLLAPRGYAVHTEVLYDVLALAALPEAAARALSEGALDGALFFSPRSARVFKDCVTEAGLAGACARLVAVCISQATADGLWPLSFAETRVAAGPNQDAMLACLG